jgi:hypothetical protein
MPSVAGIEGRRFFGLGSSGWIALNGLGVYDGMVGGI